MVHRKGIVLVQMHFIQRKQFSETSAVSMQCGAHGKNLNVHACF